MRFNPRLRKESLWCLLFSILYHKNQPKSTIDFSENNGIIFLFVILEKDKGEHTMTKKINPWVLVTGLVVGLAAVLLGLYA